MYIYHLKFNEVKGDIALGTSSEGTNKYEWFENAVIRE